MRAAPCPPDLTQEQALRSGRRKGRDERYEAILELKALGLTSIQIGANLGISHNTVQRWLKAGAAPAHDRPPKPGGVGLHAPYLEQRWQEGCRNATLLWRKLKERGYRGSERTLRRWLAERRQTGVRHQEVVDTVAAEAWKVPSSRRCAQLLTATADKVGSRESEFPTNLPVTAPDLVRRSHPLSPSVDPGWRVHRNIGHRCTPCYAGGMGSSWHRRRGLPCRLTASLTRGLQRDSDAVQAALTEPWSTGPVEGHINRLKLVKRQMYGRGKLDLLHRRVVQAA